MENKLHKKNIKLSQRIWLDRQLRDPFVKKSKIEGYRSRSAYKLIEINKKFKLFSPGSKVVDLGSAPGGWSQVISQIIKQKNKGKLYSLDTNHMEPINDSEFYQIDIFSIDECLKKKLFPELIDIVVSDMAPASTGHKLTDQLRSERLSLAALDVTKLILVDGGSFCCKMIRGGGENNLIHEMKNNFKKVNVFKPQSSRKESKEIFIVAKGFKSL